MLFSSINWVTNIRKSLNSNGFGYVWASQSLDNTKIFKQLYTQRLTDQYRQTWVAKCNVNRKLFHYHQFKREFSLEPYVLNIDIKKFRSSLASFRSSCHCLMIEEGRYRDIPK